MITALFLDRDGVINSLVNYQYGWDSPQSLQDIKLVNGIVAIIRWANDKNIPVIEISNQPGVAKGKMTQKTSDNIENKVHQLLKTKGAVINKAYICLHHPEGTVPRLTKQCHCRKPQPGLILKATQELNVNLTKSIFLGDKASDVEASKAAGLQTIIYLHQQDLSRKVKQAYQVKADFKINSLSQALPILKKFFNS